MYIIAINHIMYPVYISNMYEIKHLIIQSIISFLKENIQVFISLSFTFSVEIAALIADLTNFALAFAISNPL